MPDSIVSGTPRLREKARAFDRTSDFTFIRLFTDGTSDTQVLPYTTHSERERHWFQDVHGSCRIDEDERFISFVDTNATHNSYTVLGPQRRLIPAQAIDLSFTEHFYIPNSNQFLDLDLHVCDSIVPLPPGTLHENLMRHALMHMTRQIPREAGFNEIIQDILSLKELIPHLAESLTRTIAEGYLNWSFGWEPLLADLKSVFNLFNSVQRRLQFLRDTWGKETKLSSTKKNIWQPPAIPFYVDYGTPPFVGRLRRERYQADFRAGCYYTHFLEGLNDKLVELRAVGFALGLNNPLLAAWESLPFSFVLDWILNVDTVLDENGFNSMFSGATWIRRPTYSVTVKSLIRWGQYVDWNPILHYHNVQDETLIEVQSYRRWSGIPEAKDLFDLGSLSPTEASFLLAISAGSAY